MAVDVPLVVDTMTTVVVAGDPCAVETVLEKTKKVGCSSTIAESALNLDTSVRVGECKCDDGL